MEEKSQAAASEFQVISVDALDDPRLDAYARLTER